MTNRKIDDVNTEDTALTRRSADAQSTRQGLADDPALPLTLYGPELSYFTGKLEAVIQYKELPYRRQAAGPMGPEAHSAGTLQVPSLQLTDGRWLTDTTPIIHWLDQRYATTAVTPSDPVLAFFSLLLEDYADEWLWRPAMHYRWDYAESAALQSRVLIDENAKDMPLPGFLKRNLIRNRQRKLFTHGDGVTAATWNHVEKIYLDTLQQFDTILQARPFLLGERPSLADFGFFGPMFRHFSMDPTSARIMRETAPRVYEWVARVWNARISTATGELLDHVPEDWGALLNSIGSAYLPYLCANADAWKKGGSHFDVNIEGAPYKKIRTSRYRVWCLEQLKVNYDALSEKNQQAVRTRLEVHGCWEPLWRIQNTASKIDPESDVPFAGGSSATGVEDKAALARHWLPVAAVKPR